MLGFRILGFLTISLKKGKRKLKEAFNCHLMKGGGEGVGGGNCMHSHH